MLIFYTSLDTLYFLALWTKVSFMDKICFLNRKHINISQENKVSQKTALLIAPFLPPISAGVYRPLSWLKNAKNNHWEIDVLSYHSKGTDSDAEQKLLQEVPLGINIRRQNEEYHPIWRLSKMLDVGGSFSQSLSWAKLAISEYSEHPPQIVIASGPPFSTFIAGYFISRKFGCPLLLDYRDEWSQNPFPFVRTTRFGKMWEKKCLQHAKRVIFTTNSQKEHCYKIFGKEIYNKSIVIYNGWDEAHRKSNDNTQPDNKKYNILFAGALGTHTPFQVFLEGFGQLLENNPARKDNFQLTIVGSQQQEKVAELNQSKYKDIIKLEPQVAITDIVSTLNTSTVLLLVSTKDFERYIPGKLYYYLASKRPIIVYGQLGESQRIVESLDAGLFVKEGDIEGLSNAINIFKVELDSRWNNKTRQDWVSCHTRRLRADEFFKVLNNICE